MGRNNGNTLQLLVRCAACGLRCARHIVHYAECPVCTNGPCRVHIAKSVHPAVCALHNVPRAQCVAWGSQSVQCTMQNLTSCRFYGAQCAIWCVSPVTVLNCVWLLVHSRACYVCFNLR